MRRLPIVCLLAIAGTVPATARATASAKSTTVAVTVRPGSGGPASIFVVSFRAPEKSGNAGSVYRQYIVSADGPARARDRSCLDGESKAAAPTRAHARVRVKLVPPRSGRWCTGSFHGTVSEEQRPICPPREVCPLFVVMERTLGSFTFRVKADSSPPTFAGLQRAVQCFPGPMTPDEQRPVTLSWQAAADNLTPPSQISYDIFMASTSGGESFSTPAWTTVGKTSFTTPSLPAGRYFVVRARDRVGNEEHNRVERAAENPCV